MIGEIVGAVCVWVLVKSVGDRIWMKKNCRCPDEKYKAAWVEEYAGYKFPVPEVCPSCNLPVQKEE